MWRCPRVPAAGDASRTRQPRPRRLSRELSTGMPAAATCARRPRERRPARGFARRHHSHQHPITGHEIDIGGVHLLLLERPTAGAFSISRTSTSVQSSRRSPKRAGIRPSVAKRRSSPPRAWRSATCQPKPKDDGPRGGMSWASSASGRRDDRLARRLMVRIRFRTSEPARPGSLARRNEPYLCRCFET